jgi:hypothetical protein
MATMWSFDHSAIYRSLHLRLAIANGLSHVPHALDGVVVGLPMARRRLAGREVHPESTSEAPG